MARLENADLGEYESEEEGEEKKESMDRLDEEEEEEEEGNKRNMRSGIEAISAEEWMDLWAEFTRAVVAGGLGALSAEIRKQAELGVDNPAALEMAALELDDNF